jgi:hypothetical protein
MITVYAYETLNHSLHTLVCQSYPFGQRKLSKIQTSNIKEHLEAGQSG